MSSIGKLIGGLLMLVLWGFCLGAGLWMWNQIAERFANPWADRLAEKRELKLAEKKAATAPAPQPATV